MSEKAVQLLLQLAWIVLHNVPMHPKDRERLNDMATDFAAERPNP